MLRSELGADDAAFDHAVGRRRMGYKSGRNRHFQNDLFVGWRALDGDQCSAGAYINRGAEFKDRTPGGVSTVYKNGKSNRQTLPSPGLTFGFAHDRILKDMSAIAEITQVAVAGRLGTYYFGHINAHTSTSSSHGISSNRNGGTDAELLGYMEDGP